MKDNKQCEHNWSESRTYFADNNSDDLMKLSDEELIKKKCILSRYCKLCGKAETMIQGEWVGNGRIPPYLLTSEDLDMI